MVYRYDRQLSNRVLKLYLRTFGDTDYVSVLFDSDSCSILWEGFMVTVDCTMQHITQEIYAWCSTYDYTHGEKSLALIGLNLRRSFSCCINQLLISLRILITFHLI